MNLVYILYSKFLDRYYAGETMDLEERIKQHNSKFYDSAYTEKGTDWVLFHSIECKDRLQARKIEAHIKKMKSKTYIQNLKRFSEMNEKLITKYS